MVEEVLKIDACDKILTLLKDSKIYEFFEISHNLKIDCVKKVKLM